MLYKKRHDQLLRELDAQRELLTRLDAAIVVRDPGSARSVDAFEGLRKAVVAANKDRQARVAQLVVLADMLEHGATLDAMRARISESLRESGIVRWEDPTPREFFEIVDGVGDELEVTSPAWVELQGDEKPRLVKPGTARLHPTSEAIDAQEPPSDGSTTELGHTNPTHAMSAGSDEGESQ